MHPPNTLPLWYRPLLFELEGRWFTVHDLHEFGLADEPSPLGRRWHISSTKFIKDMTRLNTIIVQPPLFPSVPPKYKLKGLDHAKIKQYYW